MAQPPALSCKNLRFAWPNSPRLLHIDDFHVARGERLFLRGPSGSGKSTLLGLIAGVITPQDGEICVMQYDMATLKNSARDAIRADHIGVIFQQFNLVPYLSVTKNVALPCQFSSARMSVAKQAGGVETEAKRLLARLGLDDPSLLKRNVTDLSVGQQQRVAAARALIGSPSLIIADEPTSALDADSRDRFIELLSEEATRSGAALLFVSHDSALAPLFDRAVDLGEINLTQMAEAV